jgi:phage host-nuclease inhibitor protein Gam
MIYNFIENPFANSRLNDAEFGMFAKSHVQFLTAANTNDQYTALIARLQPHYQAFELWLEKYDSNITNRKGKTKTIDSIMAAFKVFVKKEVYKEVHYKFSDNPEIFNAFFPSGLTEYNKIIKKSASVLFDRIDKACSKYKADLPQGLDTKAANFNIEYETALQNQLSGKGSVKDTSEEGNILRDELSWALYDNLLDLLKMNRKNEKAILALYDANTLNKSKKKRKVVEKGKP